MATILIIDDETELLEELEFLLSEQGFSVLTAKNGREGIRMFHAAKPSIVITDILMPEQEGIETIRELRKIQPALKIIAISGGGLIEPSYYLSQALQLGADYVLEKPFEFNELSSLLRQLSAPIAHIDN